MQQNHFRINYPDDENDEDIYKITVQKNNKQCKITEIKYEVKLNQYVVKDQMIATFFYQLPQSEDIQQHQIKIIQNGTVTYLHDVTNLDQQKIHIASLQKCEHEFMEMPEDNSRTCIKCLKKLYIYELPNSNKDLKVSDLTNGWSDIFITEWNIKQNSRVCKNQVIAKYKIIKSDNYEEGEELELQFKNSSKIKQIHLKEKNIYINDPVLITVQETHCSHEIIAYQICTYCLEPVSESNNKSHRGFSQDNNVRFGGNIAKELNDNLQKGLKKNKKLILVLDLDNTILHAIPVSYKYNTKRFHDEDQDIFEIQMQTSEKFVVKVRQYFSNFLNKVKNDFDIYVFTMANKSYAWEVCKFIQFRFKEQLKGYPEHFTYEKIISREDYLETQKKDLSKILPESEQIMVILDDYPQIWEFSKNLVYTKPFWYWDESQKRDQAKIIVEARVKDQAGIRKIEIKDQTNQSQTDEKQNQNGSQNEIQKEINKESQKNGIKRKTEDIEVVVQEHSIKMNFEHSFQQNIEMKNEEELAKSSENSKDKIQEESKQENNQKQNLSVTKEEDQKTIKIQIQEGELHSQIPFEEKENGEDLNSNLTFQKPKPKENYLKCLKIRRKNDCFLYFAGLYLQQMREKFYSESQENQDIRQINQNLHSNILKDLKICFTGILLQNQTSAENRFYQRAKELGAIIVDSFSRKREVDCLIVRDNRNTSKYKTAEQQNIPIVFIDWIDYCFILNYRLKFDCFLVQKCPKEEFSNHDLIEQKLVQLHQEN